MEARFSYTTAYTTAAGGMHFVTDPEDGNTFVYGKAYPGGAGTLVHVPEDERETTR